MAHTAFHDIAERQQRFVQALKAGRLTPQDSHAVREQYAYVYKEGTLGMGRSGAAEPAKANDKDGSIPFTVSVYSEDRDGDIVVPMGCYLGNYARNPVIFLGHQQWEIPIGISRAPSGQITVFPQKDCIKAIAYFDRADPDADFIYGKCKRGILNAASIAFVPIEAYRRDEIEKARTHGESGGMMPVGWLFKKYDLTEWSVVGVPANAGAIRDAVDAEKSFLSPRLQKGLRAYAAQAKGCWGGWCPVEDVSVKACACHDCQQGRDCPCEQKKAGAKQGAFDDKTRHAPALVKGHSRKFATQAVVDDGAGQNINPPPGVREDKSQPSDDIDSARACQILEEDAVHGQSLTEDQRRLFAAACHRNKKAAKAMTSDSGQAGGYLNDAGKLQANDGAGSEVRDIDTTGYEFCPHCNGTGNCPECEGRGEHRDRRPCEFCDGSGECPHCAGAGQVQKQATPTVEKAMTDDETPESADATATDETAAATDDLPPVPDKASVDEPFNPKASARVAGLLYNHYKDALAYLDQELPGMDNPGMKAWLDSHKEYLSKAMQHLADGLAENHPDHDLEKLCKAVLGDAQTTNPAADLNLTGEAGAVNAGDVPPETPAVDPVDGVDTANPADAVGAEPYDDTTDKNSTDEAPMADDTDPAPVDTDADTEEILERYRHPKSNQWAIRKHRLRRTPDGRVYLVRTKADDDDKPEIVTGSGSSAELSEGDTPAPFNKALADEVGAAGEFLADLAQDQVIPKTYRGVAKQYAQRLGAVEKQLSNAGKLQRNGGSGRVLAQTGRTQRNGGDGETLSEAGKPQRNSRSRAQVTGSGSADGLQDGKAPYNKGQKTTLAQEIQQEYAALKRAFAQATGQGLGVDN